MSDLVTTLTNLTFSDALRALADAQRTIDGATLQLGKTVVQVVDKARVLAHLRQQMAEHNIPMTQEGAEHGDA